MFKKLSNLSKASKQQEEGQGLVEYALILVLVSVVVVVVLSLVGPAVGNIFSQVVSVLDGGDVPEDEGGCTKVPTMNWWVDVAAGGKIPAGSMQYIEATCTNQAGGGIDFDSVQVSAGAGVATATAACQSHFGKTLRFPNQPNSEIWSGSGFWYCTP